MSPSCLASRARTTIRIHVRISADGSGLEMADAKSDSADDQRAAKAAPQPLEAEPDSALPVPKEHTMSSIAAGKLPGSEIPFRRELEASIPADLASVLAFYRSELGKLGWKEAAERAGIKPDRVRLAFTSPDGPGALSLGRKNNETTVNLAQKIPGRRRQGRGAAEARSGQTVARQPRRYRGRDHHQQADRQDRGWCRWAAHPGPDAGFAARQIQICGEGREAIRPETTRSTLGPTMPGA